MFVTTFMQKYDVASTSVVWLLRVPATIAREFKWANFPFEGNVIMQNKRIRILLPRLGKYMNMSQSRWQRSVETGEESMETTVVMVTGTIRGDTTTAEPC